MQLARDTAPAETQSRPLGLDWALRAFARRWVIILACFLAGGAAAYLVTRSQERRYASTATLLFRDPGFDRTLFGGVNLSGDRPERIAATNISLVQSPEIARRAARRLGGDTRVDEIIRALTVTSAASADLAAVTAEADSPRRAADVANAVGEEYIRFRQEADRRKVAQARQGLEAQLSSLPADSERAGDVQDRIEQLQTLEFLQTGNAELVQRAEPRRSPIAPRPRRSGILGAAAGLVLGLALALLLERRDRRIRELDEVEADSDTPVLGNIPESRSLAARGPLTGLRPADREPFALLVTRLRYLYTDRDVRTVLVTSPTPGDGKSTVAWHLAAAGVETGLNVLLVEADLRRPTLAQHDGIQTGPGLVERLRGARTDQVIQTVPLPLSEGTPARGLDVITSGTIPPNPVELMQSAEMGALLRDFEGVYDLVVIDTPPVSIVPDAIPLVRQVDGVLVVVRLGKSRRDTLQRLLAQLRGTGGDVLGVVANAVPDAQTDYYGYDYEPPAGGSSRRLRRRSDQKSAAV